jgi:hypothetical protein
MGVSLTNDGVVCHNGGSIDGYGHFSVNCANGYVHERWIFYLVVFTKTLSDIETPSKVKNTKYSLTP